MLGQQLLGEDYVQMYEEMFFEALTSLLKYILVLKPTKETSELIKQTCILCFSSIILKDTQP